MHKHCLTFLPPAATVSSSVQAVVRQQLWALHNVGEVVVDYWPIFHLCRFSWILVTVCDGERSKEQSRQEVLGDGDGPHCECQSFVVFAQYSAKKDDI